MLTNKASKTLNNLTRIPNDSFQADSRITEVNNYIPSGAQAYLPKGRFETLIRNYYNKNKELEVDSTINELVTPTELNEAISDFVTSDDIDTAVESATEDLATLDNMKSFLFTNLSPITIYYDGFELTGNESYPYTATGFSSGNISVIARTTASTTSVTIHEIINPFNLTDLTKVFTGASLFAIRKISISGLGDFYPIEGSTGIAFSNNTYRITSSFHYTVSGYSKDERHYKIFSFDDDAVIGESCVVRLYNLVFSSTE
jgi:hypothetical protein